PAQKIVNRKAVFSGLDKITGRITSFDTDIGETVQFGALRVKTDACYTRPATEAANTDAFVEVDEITLQGEVKRIFSGWMFAASPGLHGVEHPVYDVWLTDCKEPEATVAASEPAPAPAPRAAPVREQKRQPRAARPPQPAPPPRQPSLLPPVQLSLIAQLRSMRGDRRKRRGAVHRRYERCGIGFAVDGMVEQGQIAPPRNFYGTELTQMVGYELRVEQHEAAGDQPRDEVHQRHLRGVAGLV